MMCESMSCTYTELQKQPNEFIEKWKIYQRAKEAAAQIDASINNGNNN